jgi:hypothetical protein
MLVCVEDLFLRMNTALRTRSEELPRWKSFIWHVITGLRALPRAKGTTVYRAVGGSVSADESVYKVGARICWNTFASTTSSEATAKQFLRRLPAGMLFVIVCDSGRSIESVSPFGSRLKEVLFEPGSEFVVTSVAPMEGTLAVTVVSMTEVPARASLVDDEERRTVAAIDALDAKRPADARDNAMAAIRLNPNFVPALLVLSVLRTSHPSLFRQGDPTVKECIVRARAVQEPHKTRADTFCTSLLAAGQPAKRTGSRLLVAGMWLLAIQGSTPDAVRALRASVEQDSSNCWAQHTLGSVLQDGDGAPRDLVGAANAFRKAAEQGHADA